LYIGLLSVFSQTTSKDTTYKSRKLKVDEINLVSSYYKQDGDHAAVTGGIGSQHLTDISNSFDIKPARRDKKNRKQSFELELGADYFTSASTDMVDKATLSSASSDDARKYGSFTYSSENEQKEKEQRWAFRFPPNTITIR
jgi:hypothetical protein